jgi:hypothetical protein
MKTKKEQALSAMRIVLQEYKEKRHETRIATCALCQIFFADGGSGWNLNECRKCPMFAFNDDAGLPCLNRKCAPVSCQENQQMSKNLKMVTVFYEKAIKKLESLPISAVTGKNGFKFLVEVDAEVVEIFKNLKHYKTYDKNYPKI